MLNSTRIRIQICLSLFLITIVSVELTVGKPPMSGGLVLTQQPAITIPKTHYGDVDEDLDKPESVIVSIPAEGEFYIGRDRIQRGDSELAEKIRDLLADALADQQKVYVRSPGAVRFANIRRVYNAMREVGFDRVGFVTQSVGSPPQNTVLETTLVIPDGVIVDPSDRITVPPRKVQPRPSVPPPPPPPRVPPPPPGRGPSRVTVPLGLSPSAIVVEVKSGAANAATVLVNTRPVKIEELTDLLADALEERISREIYIKPAREVSYEQVIDALDAIEGSGCEHIAMLIDEVAVPKTLLKVKEAGPPREVLRVSFRGVFREVKLFARFGESVLSWNPPRPSVSIQRRPRSQKRRR